jgi:integrase
MSAVTKAHVRDYKAHLLSSSSRQSKRLSRRTVQKALVSLCSIFRWGVAHDYLSVNPFDGLTTLPKDRSGATQEEPTKRRPFTDAELHTLFQHETFKAPVLAPTAPPRSCIGTGKAPKDFRQEPLAARFWLPILGVYTGCRLEELAGLRKQDIGVEDGVAFLSLVPHADRPLKTASSRRRIPLHPEVVRAGFLRYVEACSDGGRIFTDLKPGRFNKLAGPYSTAFARLMDECGLTDPRLTFHSLRHTFTDALRRAKVEPELRSQLLGHAHATMTAGYGAGA